MKTPTAGLTGVPSTPVQQEMIDVFQPSLSLLLTALLVSGAGSGPAMSPAPNPLQEALGGEDAECTTGKVAGRWNGPDPDGAGRLVGALVQEDGTRILGVRAAIGTRPVPGPLSGGPLRGALVLPPEDPEQEGAEPEVVARVVGSWLGGPGGRGIFEAVFYAPGATDEDPPQRIGRMRGTFRADPGKGGQRFVGRFRLCP